MPSAEAHIPTPRADRYLHQLCDHLDHMSPGERPTTSRSGTGHGAGRGADDTSHGAGHGSPGHDGPPRVLRVHRAENRAHIEFDWGTCDLTATANDLTVRVSADHLETLARGQQLLQQRIETIGRRDQLAVTWDQPTVN